MVNGLFVRSVDSLHGSVTDMDVKDGHHRVKVEFPHNQVDTYKTTFNREAFRESFAERRPVMCWQHDLRDPIGTAESAEVLRNHNELVGRFSKFNEETGVSPAPNALRAYTQIRDGELKDFSFGFRDPVFVRHPDFRGVRDITKATMREFSPVTVGSIPGAMATGIREEDVMAQYTVAEIMQLREAGMVSEEDAAQLIRDVLGNERGITILSPKAAAANGAGADTGATGGERHTEVVPGEGDGGERDDDLPERLNATEIFAKLPETWQRALHDHEARIILVVGPEEWGPLGENAGGERSVDDETLQLLATADAAARSAVTWVQGLDLAQLPEEVRQAVELWKAGGVATDSALEVLDPDGTFRADAEDMASKPVKCGECDGTGKTEDGKVCPRCGGTGIEAVQRADTGDDMEDCPTCKGEGKLPAPAKGGHRLTCPDCKGKGKVTVKRTAEIWQFRASFSNKPWSDFSDADFSPEQLKASALVSTGDTKDDQHLPVREPDGTLNRNAIHAAAGRLNQTSSLSDEQKGMAANKLVKLYAQMGEEPPENVSKYATRAEPDDDDDSQDDMVDESGNGKPSGTGAAAGEDTGDTPAGDADKTAAKKDDDPERALARLGRHRGIAERVRA